MDASNAARLQESFKNIADIVRLPGEDGTKVNVLQLVYNWLCGEGYGRWLMVVDNADNENVFDVTRQDWKEEVSNGTGRRLTLMSLPPQSQNGSILITSQNRNVAVKLAGRDKDIIQIHNMSHHQGLELLRKKLSGPLDGPASDLLAALDGISLAIVQAAA